MTIGKLSAETPCKEYIYCEDIAEWNVTPDGLDIILSDGNLYHWN